MDTNVNIYGYYSDTVVYTGVKAIHSSANCRTITDTCIDRDLAVIQYHTSTYNLVA